MNKLQAGCLIIGIYVASNFVLGWTVEGDNSRAWYQCCCPQCPNRQSWGRTRGCFSCRNREFFCNCDNCSCFPPVREHKVEEDPSSKYTNTYSLTRIQKATAQAVFARKAKEFILKAGHLIEPSLTHFNGTHPRILFLVMEREIPGKAFHCYLLPWHCALQSLGHDKLPCRVCAPVTCSICRPSTEG